MHRALAICVLLATATAAAGAPAHPFNSWLSQSQLPAQWQLAAAAAAAAAARRAEALPASAVDTTWFNAANDTGNRMMYFVQTKQELFVFNGVPPAVSAPTPTAGASTRAPAAGAGLSSASSSSLSPWSTSPPDAAPAPRTAASAPSTTGAPLPISTVTPIPIPISTIPPGYTYYSATGSYYKIHKWQASWHDANATCASEGADLVVLDDAEEVDIVARIIKDAGHNYYSTWTGHQGSTSESTTGHGGFLSGVIEWEFSDSPPQKCTVFSAQQKQLYRFPCDSTWYFICERSQ